MTRVNSLIAASVAAVGLFVLTAPPVATAAEVTPAQITAARTAADHEAIAVAYEGEAAAAAPVGSWRLGAGPCQALSSGVASAGLGGGESPERRQPCAPGRP